MARYYEETALIEFVKKYTPTINGETTMKCVVRAIREAPTADVVPKSEYDAVVSAIDNSTKEFLKLHDDYQKQKTEADEYKHCWQKIHDSYTADCLEHYNKGRTEVAREIFELIDCAFSPVLVYNGYTVKEYLAELKKKYTGEKE